MPLINENNLTNPQVLFGVPPEPPRRPVPLSEALIAYWFLDRRLLPIPDDACNLLQQRARQNNRLLTFLVTQFQRRATPRALASRGSSDMDVRQLSGPFYSERLTQLPSGIIIDKIDSLISTPYLREEPKNYRNGLDQMRGHEIGGEDIVYRWEVRPRSLLERRVSQVEGSRIHLAPVGRENSTPAKFTLRVPRLEREDQRGVSNNLLIDFTFNPPAGDTTQFSFILTLNGVSRQQTNPHYQSFPNAGAPGSVDPANLQTTIRTLVTELGYDPTDVYVIQNAPQQWTLQLPERFRALNPVLAENRDTHSGPGTLVVQRRDPNQNIDLSSSGNTQVNAFTLFLEIQPGSTDRLGLGSPGEIVAQLPTNPFGSIGDLLAPVIVPQSLRSIYPWKITIEFGEVYVEIHERSAESTIQIGDQNNAQRFEIPRRAITTTNTESSHYHSYALTFIPVWNGVLVSDSPPSSENWIEKVVYFKKNTQRDVFRIIDDILIANSRERPPRFGENGQNLPHVGEGGQRLLGLEIPYEQDTAVDFGHKLTVTFERCGGVFQFVPVYFAPVTRTHFLMRGDPENSEPPTPKPVPDPAKTSFPAQDFWVQPPITQDFYETPRYTITFSINGVEVTTTPIDYNADPNVIAQAIATALNTIPGRPTGGVEVNDYSLQGWTVRFTGDLANANIPMFTFTRIGNNWGGSTIQVQDSEPFGRDNVRNDPDACSGDIFESHLRQPSRNWVLPIIYYDTGDTYSWKAKLFQLIRGARPYWSASQEYRKDRPLFRRPIQAWGLLLYGLSDPALGGMRNRDGALTANDVPPPRVRTVSINRSLDGANGTITWDRYDPVTGMAARPPQNVGAIRIAGVGGIDTIPGVIFTGIGMGNAERDSRESNEISIPLHGKEAKMSQSEGGLVIINAPYFDGFDHREVMQWLCDYAGVPFATFARPYRLPSGVLPHYVVDFKSGTYVWDAIGEVQKLSATVAFFDRFGVLRQYDVGRTSGVNWVYPDAKIVSYDDKPDLAQMRNVVVVLGLVATGETDVRVAARQGTTIDSQAMMVKRRAQTTPSFPWDKMFFYVIPGTVRIRDLNRTADKLIMASSQPRASGTVTIPGNGQIELFDSFNGAWIVTQISHNIDTQQKTWTTSLSLELIVAVPGDDQPDPPPRPPRPSNRSQRPPVPRVVNEANAGRLPELGIPIPSPGSLPPYTLQMAIQVTTTTTLPPIMITRAPNKEGKEQIKFPNGVVKSIDWIKASPESIPPLRTVPEKDDLGNPENKTFSTGGGFSVLGSSYDSDEGIDYEVKGEESDEGIDSSINDPEDPELPVGINNPE